MASDRPSSDPPDFDLDDPRHHARRDAVARDTGWILDLDELRHHARRAAEATGTDWTPGLEDALSDAVAEIERLRAELSAAQRPAVFSAHDDVVDRTELHRWLSEDEWAAYEAATHDLSSGVGWAAMKFAFEVAHHRSVAAASATSDWPPLMRAAEVNELWQQGAWNVAVGRQNADGLYDWLPLNEVCESRHSNPFLPELPNLLVVAAPWEGAGQMPTPPGGALFDPDAGDPFDPSFSTEFPPSPSNNDPVAGELFATQYVIDGFAPDDDDHGIWQIRVVWRGRGMWAVQRGGFPEVLNDAGEWEYELSPSNRDDDFLDRCRFRFDDAVAMAVEALPRLVGPGNRTVSEHAAFRAEQDDAPTP